MAVKITEECISCNSCVDMCPVQAILEADENPTQEEVYYVQPEICIECVDHASEPACAEVCPTEDCIVWDMPFTAEYNAHYVESKEYVLKVHKKKGIFSPQKRPKPYREDIGLEERVALSPVSN